MPLLPKQMDPDVLTAFIEKKKDSKDAYTELLAHILFMEQKEDTMMQILQSVMMVLETLPLPGETRGDLNSTLAELRRRGLIK